MLSNNNSQTGAFQKAWRRLENAFPSPEEAQARILKDKNLTVYLGIDPTSPNIHLGHTIPLLFLKNLLDLGHQPIIIIGNFTAKIGDPSGRESARKPLADEEIAENEKTYLEQIHRILPEGKFTVRHNGEWLAGLNFAEILNLASHLTVQKTIARDMFQERIKKGQPIGLHEFLYPLMQGYDSIRVVEGGVDGEVGGNDQTFNMLVGRDLEKKILNKDKLVFATKLLVSGQGGKKMSKSESGLINIKDSPQDIYGKTMASVPDQMVKTVFELCTDRPQEEIEALAQKTAALKKPMLFKKELALELTGMYHGQKAADQAQAYFENTFSKGELPTGIKEAARAGQNVIEVIVGEGLVESRTEAKRIIDQKGVTANGRVLDWHYQVERGDVIRVGPRRFVKITN